MITLVLTLLLILLPLALILGVFLMVNFDALNAEITSLSGKVDLLIAKAATGVDPVPVQAAVDAATAAVKAVADKIVTP